VSVGAALPSWLMRHRCRYRCSHCQQATHHAPEYGGSSLYCPALTLCCSVFPCQSPEEVRAGLPAGTDVVAFQCRNPIHRAHYELFIRALDAPNVAKDGVVLVHPTCGPTQASTQGTGPG
jgi:sulfate adenylyltransferase